jgi:hypothetical protein
MFLAKKPGIPMGQAITAQVLNNNSAIADDFINWLNSLFTLNINANY